MTVSRKNVVRYLFVMCLALGVGCGALGLRPTIVIAGGKCPVGWPEVIDTMYEICPTDPSAWTYKQADFCVWLAQMAQHCTDVKAMAE